MNNSIPCWTILGEFTPIRDLPIVYPDGHISHQLVREEAQPLPALEDQPIVINASPDTFAQGGASMISTATSQAIGSAMATQTSRANNDKKRLVNIFKRAKSMAVEGVPRDGRRQVSGGKCEGIPVTMYLEREGKSIALAMTLHGTPETIEAGYKSSRLTLGLNCDEGAFLRWVRVAMADLKGEARRRLAGA